MYRLISFALIGSGLLTFVVVVPAQQSREETAMELFRRWDVNRDGQLTAAEVPPRARPELARLAREAGLDPAEGLPLDRLQKQLKEKGRRDTPDQKPKKPPSPQAKTGQEPQREAPQESAVEPSSPSFGAPNATPSTKGFGSKASPAVVTSVPKDGDAGAKPATSDKPANPPERNGQKDRVRGAAQAMLRRLDRNRNNVLDKEEWDKIRGDPAKSDANGDGVLTEDELTVHLSNYAHGTRSSPAVGRSNPTTGSTRKQNAGSGPTSGKATSRRSYRFMTATERVATLLPGDLRDSFLQNDRDGDGQIAMYEFATTWSAEKTRAFSQLDLNNDGLVTPREYVKAKTTR